MYKIAERIWGKNWKEENIKYNEKFTYKWLLITNLKHLINKVWVIILAMYAYHNTNITNNVREQWLAFVEV